MGLLIPIAVVYIENSIRKNKEDIGELNLELYKEFQDFKNEYLDKINAFTSCAVFNISEDDKETELEKLKNKAVKFINIAMVSNTKRVSEHLNIDIDKAFLILQELYLHDALISAAGQVRVENINNILWMKKGK